MKAIQLPEGFSFEGHRGCRGLLPENSIPAFIRAIELGVTTLEMDLVISKDKKVVVSHEPYLSHEICYTADGQEISQKDEKKHNLWKMEYEEIMKCDCGSKPHPRFPTQQKLKVYKPLLEDVIDAAETYTQKYNLPALWYNMEIKSVVEGDFLYHPAPAEFCELVMGVLKAKNILNRSVIQSFDVRPLQYLHKNYQGKIKLSYLIENKLTPEANLERLGFTPDIYSPDYMLVNDHLIQLTQKLGIRVIPWTVNDLPTMEKLIKAGVDGIITDYPNLLEREWDVFKQAKN